MIVARTIIAGAASHLRTRLSEWVFAAILAMFGYRLLQTGDTFASSRSYAYMASLMSEEHWGEMIGGVAGLRFLALGINGSFRMFRPWSPGIRAITAWLSAFVWCCLALGFYLSNPDATGWTTYGILFVADVCLAILIAYEAGHAYRAR